MGRFAVSIRTGLATLVFVSATAGVAADTLPEEVITSPEPRAFSVCHGGGCNRVNAFALSEDEWQRIADLFRPATGNPPEERLLIAHAIARLERITGERLHTDRDMGGTFQGLGRPGQLDCIDESVNTTSYLALLERAGLLRWHTVEDRVTRGFFLFGWPHTTAVIREKGRDARFAVDSWFEDNGFLPYIVPLSLWREGWKPPG